MVYEFDREGEVKRITISKSSFIDSRDREHKSNYGELILNQIVEIY